MRVDGQNFARGAAAQVDVEPSFQLSPTFLLGQRGETLSNFSESQNAQVWEGLVRSIYPSSDAGLGADADDLGDAIRIEQVSAHSSISRPSLCSRSKLSSRPTRGDSLKNSRRLLGCFPIRRSYCSSASITTPSLP